MKKMINGIIGNLPLIFLFAIMVWLLWSVDNVSQDKSDLDLGTHEVQIKDSTYVLTTKIDSVYYDPAPREVREMRDN